MTFCWKIEISPVLSLISTEKSDQFCLVFFSLFWSIHDRLRVDGLRLEHKGHCWQVRWPSSPRTGDVGSQLMAYCNSVTKYICQDGDLNVSRRVFCLYSTVFRSKYFQGVHLRVWVSYFLKMEEKKVGQGRVGIEIRKPRSELCAFKSKNYSRA